VRHLLFAACIRHFSFDAGYIPGAQNSRADVLSRNLFSSFPDADRSPCAVKLPRLAGGNEGLAWAPRFAIRPLPQPSASARGK